LRSLKRLNGLADRRLNAIQLASGSGEAARLIDGDEYAELVEGKRTKHDASPREMEVIIFISVLLAHRCL
jgi:hypothetical protein